MSTPFEKEGAMLAAMKSAHETNRKLHERIAELEAEVEQLIDDNCDILAKCERLRAALQRAVGYVECNGFGADQCEVLERARAALSATQGDE